MFLSVATTALAATLALLAGCNGAVGTIDLELVTAPGSTVMDEVVHARLTLSNPPTVLEAERDADGRLVFDLEVVADGVAGIATFEGFSADDQLVAFGRTPPLPIAAIDARVALYVAPPLSLAEAPVSLDPPRSELGATALSYGVLLAGGRTGDGAPAAQVVIYNAYDHAFQVGLPLPEPRAAPTVVTASFGQVFLFGGDSADGDPTGTFWRFDTNIAPAGSYERLIGATDLARAGADAAPLGQDQFVVTGSPLAILDGLNARIAPAEGAPAVPGLAATTTVEGAPFTLIAGADTGTTGAVLIARGALTEIEAPAEVLRTGHATVALPGRILVVTGALDGQLTASAVRFDAATETFTVVDDFLATPRTGAAVAASRTHLVIAGGIDADGALVPNAEVFDAQTLAPLAVVPMVAPRQRAAAEVLANGQILLAGGVDADGAPVGALELFTHAP